MAAETLVHINGVPVLECAPDGPPLAGEAAALDLIGAAFGHGAEMVVVPAGRLPDDFFALRTGVAGAMVQKFVNYRMRLVVLGDISRHLAASDALRAFVRESNRGSQLWFVDTHDDLEERFRAA